MEDETALFDLYARHSVPAPLGCVDADGYQLCPYCLKGVGPSEPTVDLDVSPAPVVAHAACHRNGVFRDFPTDTPPEEHKHG